MDKRVVDVSNQLREGPIPDEWAEIRKRNGIMESICLLPRNEWKEEYKNVYEHCENKTRMELIETYQNECKHLFVFDSYMYSFHHAVKIITCKKCDIKYKVPKKYCIVCNKIEPDAGLVCLSCLPNLNKLVFSE